MDKVENLKHTTHKEFNEFIKGKGFKGKKWIQAKRAESNVWIQTYGS